MGEIPAMQPHQRASTLALYLVSARLKNQPLRPCALCEAASSSAAVDVARELRRKGELAFINGPATFIARRARAAEIEAFQDFMQVRLVKGRSSSEINLARIATRRRAAFFEKLWRREIPGL